MDIENLDNTQLIKMLIYGEGLTQKSIAEEIGMKSANFSQLMYKNHLKLSDFQKICKILGYKIYVEKEE